MADKKSEGTLTVNGVKYEVDSLGKEAKATLQSLGAVEAELRRLRTQIEIACIAQQALGRALQEQLPKSA